MAIAVSKAMFTFEKKQHYFLNIIFTNMHNVPDFDSHVGSATGTDHTLVFSITLIFSIFL